MARYIDADKLESHKFVSWTQPEFFDEASQATQAYQTGWNNAIDAIVENEPTADVIEVVRCKDCKYMCHYTDGHLECRLLSDLKPIPTTYCTMNADDFCSYGERREDGKIH